MTRKGTKEICTTRKNTFSVQAGSVLLSFFALALLPPSGSNTISSSTHSSGGARITILPTFVSCRKVGTAGVARSSWKSSLTVGARGCFHSHSFLTLLRRSLICAAKLGN